MLFLLDSNACSPCPCLNGGTCTVTGIGLTYTCSCPSCYSGKDCQTCKIYVFI